VQPASAKVIDLVQFADVGELDPLYIDRTYYLAPDGAAAAEAYAVLRGAMMGSVGIGKLALYGREYLVAVRPQKRTSLALLLHTLHHAAEIRPLDAIDDLNVVPLALLHLAPQVTRARQVIAAFHGPLMLADFTDDYRADLQRLIDAKIAGEEIVVPKVETPAVLNLKAALERSLQAVNATKTIPAKAKSVKRMRAS
jgi:DNA end-binding protein Ku